MWWLPRIRSPNPMFRRSRLTSANLMLASDLLDRIRRNRRMSLELSASSRLCKSFMFQYSALALMRGYVALAPPLGEVKAGSRFGDFASVFLGGFNPRVRDSLRFGEGFIVRPPIRRATGDV